MQCLTASQTFPGNLRLQVSQSERGRKPTALRSCDDVVSSSIYTAHLLVFASSFLLMLTQKRQGKQEFFSS